MSRKPIVTQNQPIATKFYHHPKTAKNRDSYLFPIIPILGIPRNSP